ncbi:Epoxyqueuosine reductase [Planctomycetes bacterium Pla163]|uniref:Epoxyqueuosine reductase n=1 Tax=Rohdeia mirabilis TaxID=2528008 RepID=A0A518CWX4_9BACT|nr:Epoxyqueuosine reductase [Planctomycetes bacterium Pla163]
MNNDRTTQALVEAALELGFDLAGVAPLAPPPDAQRFRDWLAAGNHGHMDWLERQADRIADPRRVLPEGTAILVVGLGHARAPGTLADGGRVARYALGRDYHNVVGKKLRRLARRLRGSLGVGRVRSIVDAGPVLERSHGAVAGLGFPSKAANLLHRRFGPWFFLGELLVEIEGYEPEPAAPALGSCGTCTACIDACPTAAITAPGQVDARRCISYHTIESPELAPRDLRVDMGRWAFGCDVCSEVCPFGHRAPDGAATFGEHPGLAGARLADWLELDEEQARAQFEGSPLRRPGAAGLARNAAIALGNGPDEAGREALLRALERHPAPMVREAAAWALAHGHGADHGVRAALERALARESDPAQRAGLEADLDGAD